MRPPICKICKKRFSPSSESNSGLVYFRLSKKDKSFNQNMKSKQMVGHPRGREWFCEVHYQKAKTYKHLTIKQAMRFIKKSD